MAYDGREVFIVSNKTKDGYVRGVIYVGTLKADGAIEFTTGTKGLIDRIEPEDAVDTVGQIQNGFDVTISGETGPFDQKKLKELFLRQNPDIPYVVSDLRALRTGGRKSKRRRPKRKSKRKTRR